MSRVLCIDNNNRSCQHARARCLHRSEHGQGLGFVIDGHKKVMVLLWSRERLVVAAFCNNLLLDAPYALTE